MSDLFRKEALDNRRERLWGEVVLAQPLSFRLLTVSFLLIVSLVAMLLAFGTYARRENVTGFVVPDTGLVKVYARAQGLISDVHVEEGEQVQAGDVLVTVSTAQGDERSADVQARILEELLDSKATLQRRRQGLQALHALRDEQRREAVPRRQREIERLVGQLAVHERRESRARAQLERVEALARSEQLDRNGFTPTTDLIDAREAQVDARLSLGDARRKLSLERDELADARAALREGPLAASVELAELDERLSEVVQQILQARGRRSYTLRAPSTGRVTALQVTPGQRVREERPLLTLLPADARFRADLFVPTRAIGFVAPGQSVLLRYGAFPYERFGVHAGTIDKVTRTILQPDELDVPVRLEEPVYRVSVVPDEQAIQAYGQAFELQAGMLLDASILLEGRSLGEWLLAPVFGLRGHL